MPNPRSAELRQQRRQLIAETILVRRARDDQMAHEIRAPRNVLRGIRRPDVERQPELSDIVPVAGWALH